MLAYFIIPSLIGIGLTFDYVSSLMDVDADDGDDGPLQLTLADDVLNFDGTGANEHVQGNALDNRMTGGDGTDMLSGLDGDDTLEGGPGNDRIIGSAGNDHASGGAGNDRIFLGDGDDTSVPNVGTLDDVGNDFIRGGAGSDEIVDLHGSNQIYGDTGQDNIVTVDGINGDGTLGSDAEYGTTDTVHGGYGDDTLFGDAGDILTGGEGEDNFLIATASQTPGTPSILTDFNHEDDLLSLVFMDAVPEDTTVDFAHDPETNQLHAIVDGHTVASLQGLTAEDAPYIRTFVTTLPELLATSA